MIKYILIILLFVSNFLHAQVDTIIKTPILESYFSYKYHNPLYVKYKLYQGGGDCERNSNFTTDNLPNSATQDDYYKSGYDRGHLANAEDFAFNCEMESMTFKYYNCVPQTPNLNRGIWKTYETKIRAASQTDSLLIICGSIFGNEKIPNTNVSIPKYCWKVVVSLSTNKILYCLLFTNLPEKNTVTEIPLEKLMMRFYEN